MPKVAPDAAKPARTEAKPSGRIVHDERGNAVWNFGNDTARTASGASTILRRLNVPELQMEDHAPSASAPTPARAKSPPAKRKDAPKRDEGGGYNPYDAPAKGRGRGR